MRKGVRTFADDFRDRRWNAKFLGVLLAIPVAGVIGIPLLILLLILFCCNPCGLGTYVGNWRPLKHIPGFRSGKRAYMVAASLLYLLPLSLMGILVVGVDVVLLGLSSRECFSFLPMWGISDRCDP